MHRKKLTEQLARILSTIDAGQTPLTIEDCYAFGDFVNGVSNPQRLELIIRYRYPTPAQRRRAERQFVETSAYTPYGVIDYLETQCRKALRRPGEKTVILLVRDLRTYVDNKLSIKPSELFLLWSRDDRKWERKLALLREDPTATPVDRRATPFPLAGLNYSWFAVHEVIQHLEQQGLQLTRIPMAGVKLRLNETNQALLQSWRQSESVGHQLARLLPLGLQWLQDEGQAVDELEGLILKARGRSHRVLLGRARLDAMLGGFSIHAVLQKQCLIPHLRRTRPNEMLVFSRGPHWDKVARRQRGRDADAGC